jgi:hypothetical protein
MEIYGMKVISHSVSGIPGKKRNCPVKGFWDSLDREMDFAQTLSMVLFVTDHSIQFSWTSTTNALAKLENFFIQMKPIVLCWEARMPWVANFSRRFLNREIEDRVSDGFANGFANGWVYNWIRESSQFDCTQKHIVRDESDLRWKQDRTIRVPANVLDSIPFNWELDSNEIDESDLHDEKHVEPRISKPHGIRIDFNEEEENAWDTIRFNWELQGGGKVMRKYLDFSLSVK